TSFRDSVMPDPFETPASGPCSPGRSIDSDRTSLTPGAWPGWTRVGLLGSRRWRRRSIEEDDIVNDWLETYRGIVYRWEVDHNDHLTVAFYFARLGDATLAVLDSLGLGAAYTRRRGSLCLTADCYVRYVRELRVGDIMHVTSGVIAVERDALVLGHKLFNSETGEVCTTIEQRLRHVDARRRAARPIPAPLRPPPAPLRAPSP